MQKLNKGVYTKKSLLPTFVFDHLIGHSVGIPQIRNG